MKKLKSVFSVINRVVKDIILRRIDDRYIVGVDSAFVISGYSEARKCVYLRPNESFPLYGVSLLGGGNLPTQISYFKRLVETYGANEDSRLFCFYTKSSLVVNGDNKNFATKQNLYIFSHSRPLLGEISQYYEVDLMLPKELFLAFLDIGLNGDYYNDKETLEMKSYLETIDLPVDKMSYIFRALFAEGIYGAITKTPVNSSPMVVYQGVGTTSYFAPNKPDMIGAMQMDWRGYLCIVLELNTGKIQWQIEQTKSYVTKIELDKEIKNGYRMIAEEFEKSPSDFLMINISLVMDTKNVLQDVSEALNINFIEKKLYAKDLLYQTAIRERDVGYDFIITTEDAKNFISQIHREHNPALIRPAEICGRDVCGNYTQFSFYESAVPHSAVIAKSRSGKTVFVLGIIAQALRARIVSDRYYVEDNRSILENSPVIVEGVSRLGKEVGIVQFDIGYSGLKWVKALEKSVPKQVSIYTDDLNKLRFGLTNVNTYIENGKMFVDKMDALFLIKTISSLLELNGESPLSAHEAQAIIDALAELFADKTYRGFTIAQLREVGGYDILLDKIQNEVGELDDFASITELDLPSEYDFCQVPLFSDVIRVLKIRSKAQRLEDIERKNFTSAALKLRSLSEDPFFGYYATSDTPSADYFYMELESLKKLGDNIFIPIYLMVFQQQYRKDIAKAQEAKNNNKATLEQIYIMEEAHNLFKVPSIASFFGEVVREAARYGIVLIFISQNADDVPEEILLNLGNRILMPAPGKDRENQIGQLNYFWQTNDESSQENKRIYSDFFKRYSKRFSAVIKNANGVFMLEQHMSKEAIWLFNSDAVAKKFESEV